MNAYVRLRAAGMALGVSAVLALGGESARGQSPAPAARAGKGPHVRVELITDRATPGPGMRLGLKFDLDPEWHIYWQNPGDSGGSPEVAWTLPPGMMASGIEWPAPERIDVGGLVNYGYHDRVVLPVAVAVAVAASEPFRMASAASTPNR